jgi:glucoamylase
MAGQVDTNGPAPRPAAPAGQSFTSGAKDLVTTALSARVWATVGHGILTEIYWPAVDQPQIKDFGFLVAGDGWWRELKRVGRYTITTPDPTTPLPTLIHSGPGYQVTLTVVPDPARDALLIAYRLQPAGLRLLPLLAPHMGVYRASGAAGGEDNHAWVDLSDHTLFASDGAGRFVGLLAEPGFRSGSAGYVGASDGWTDLSLHGQMTWRYDQAGPGTVALTGELTEVEGLLALAFGGSADEARAVGRAALAAGPSATAAAFAGQWSAWAAGLSLPAASNTLPAGAAEAARQSAVVLRVHEDRQVPGAFVAGLAVPWGDFTNDPGGYHMVWCRDGVETGLALAAAGHADDALRLLRYLMERQDPVDGHWPRCFFVDGSSDPAAAVQFDEVAFPVLLAGKLRDLGAALPDGVDAMVRRAASYLAHSGPMSGATVDRWEETAGASPFTVGVEVAALVVAAQWLSGADQRYALALADCWNERIEEWTFVAAGEVDQAFGTSGHYVRIGPSPESIRVANQPDGAEAVVAERLVGLDFLYLVRLGLRGPLDRRIVDTITVIEQMLARDTPNGRAYYRYNLDGYGEWTDGSGWPARRYGIGRPWPLLAGERGHYEKLAGGDPGPQLLAMLAMRGRGHLLPEQVWDANPIPWYGLRPGEPSGSAMPLAWAHSELIKLVLTATSGRPVELLEAVAARYAATAPAAATWYWQDVAPVQVLPAGRSLVVQDARPFTLHFGFDGWNGVTDLSAQPLGLDMYGAALDPGELAGHASLQFVRRYADHWEPADRHDVVLGGPAVTGRRLPLAERGRVAAAGGASRPAGAL